MSQRNNGSQGKDEQRVRDAVVSQIAKLDPEWQDILKLHANGAAVLRTRVDWQIRLECGASLAMEKSSDLANILVRIQEGVEADLREDVTVLLDS